MGYFSELAIELGYPKARHWQQGGWLTPPTLAERWGFRCFNAELHAKINARMGDKIPAHLRRGPRWMVIGFRYDNPGPGVPVLIRHFYTWADADLFADRLIEQDVLQLAYLKEY